MVLYPNKLPESERVCSGICTECLRLPKISIGNMMPDVIIYKKDNYSDEYKLFVSNKLKITD